MQNSADELRGMSRRLTAIAAELGRTQAPDQAQKDDLSLTSWLLRARAARSKFFPEQALTESSWVVLLELYHARLQKELVSMTGLYARGIPTGTAVRSVQLLIENGLAKRSLHPEDKRRSFVALTKDGEERMAAYLAWLRQP